MRTIMVLNAKGGSGKTTLATNMAGYFASQNKNTVIKDYDPQGSSMDWLEQRNYSQATIHGLEMFKPPSPYVTKAFATRLPANVQRVVIDTPASVDLNRLHRVLMTVDKIVIPVSPSAIDVRATIKFIRELKDYMKLHQYEAEIGLVANRVDIESEAYHSMQSSFNNIDLEFIASLPEHNDYLISAECGSSIFELNSMDVAMHKFDWAPLINWLEDEVVEPLRLASIDEPRLYAVVD